MHSDAMSFLNFIKLRHLQFTLIVLPVEVSCSPETSTSVGSFFWTSRYAVFLAFLPERVPRGYTGFSGRIATYAILWTFPQSLEAFSIFP